MGTSPLVWLTLIIVIIQQIGVISTQDLSDNSKLDSVGLATKYGHPPTEYTVLTEDGYILTLYRLPGKGRIPILLTHGFLDSSDTFLNRGNTSLAIRLANKGYDIWVANFRGNKYSRRHQTLNPDTDSAYWKFSFHEMGYYDLPAIIDTVLNLSGANSLTAVGHSQGTTVYYVLGSTRTEYNSKINVMMSLAPIAFMQNVNGPLALITKLSPLIAGLVKELGIHELFGKNTALGKIAHTLCSVPVIGYTICVEGVMFLAVGADPTEFEEKFWLTMAPRYPDGASSQSLLHFLQVGYSKTFAQFDYGNETNQKLYNSSQPPEYQLGQVTMPVALFTASNDYFSSIADVDILRGKLPNVVYYLLNPRLICNHIDYVWGRTMSVYLDPYINYMLKIYNPL